MITGFGNLNPQNIIPPRVFKLAWPLMLGMMSQVILNVSDAAMVGHLEPISARALAATGLGAKYDTAVDRDSAYERLQARAETAAKAAADAEAEEEKMKAELRELKQARRYDGKTVGRSTSTRSSRSDSLATTFGKSLARQLGTKSGQALVRGILGSLFKSR